MKNLVVRGVVTSVVAMGLVAAAAGVALASSVGDVPEISPASISGGLALLAGAVLMVGRVGGSSEAQKGNPHEKPECSSRRLRIAVSRPGRQRCGVCGGRCPCAGAGDQSNIDFCRPCDSGRWRVDAACEASEVTPTQKETPMRNVIARGTSAILTLACLVVALEGVAAAMVPQPRAPEISPASLSAGLAILVSGGLILRSRRRK